MARYILDQTGIDPANPCHGLRLQCKPGKFERDFDIDECDIPRDMFQKLQPKKPAGYEHWPIGFDYIDAMRQGARLIKIIEEKPLLQKIIDYIGAKK